MQEGTIARWLKKAGDEIKKGDILAEIETDKATMDLEAYEAGTLQQVLVQEGETVPVGQAVALIGNGRGQDAEQAVQPAPAAARAGADGAGASPPESPPKAEASTQSKRPAIVEGGEREEIKASPLARRMAEEHSIDLSQVQGTGPGGRIVRDDIEDFLEQRAAPSAPAAPAPASQPVAPPQAIPAPAAPLSAPPETEVVKLSRVQTAHRTPPVRVETDHSALLCQQRNRYDGCAGHAPDPQCERRRRWREGHRQ